MSKRAGRVGNISRRLQTRAERAAGRPSATPAPRRDRRTPVSVTSPGGRVGPFSYVSIAIALAAMAIVAILAFAVVSAQKSTDPNRQLDWQKAMLDSSDRLPGQYVPPHPGPDGQLCQEANCAATNDDRQHVQPGTVIPICTEEQKQSGNVSNWQHRLWKMEKHHHWLGQSGGYGVGYGAAAAVGGALANRDLGRFSVSIQGDGDLMYAPGVLWTAAKHKIPLLSVMHNNRGYHQELMHVQRLSSFRNRVASLGGDIGPIGTSIMNPDIEYHKLAESMGWWAKGPITDPDKLGPALKEAVAAVKSGQPALLNVWTQPR